jgi:hypothetical protein
VYTSLVIDPPKELRLNHVLLVFGLLKPGVSRQQAQAEMDTISSHMDQTYPEIRDWGLRLVPGQLNRPYPQCQQGSHGCGRAMLTPIFSHAAARSGLKAD